MRVLIVDDNAHSLRGLEVVIGDLGHEAVGAVDAMQALDRLAREEFPLVITDIRMPGLDGLELLTRIKANPRTARVDVVLITGHGDMETAIEALRKGAYDYLNKPINARELAAVVERCAEHQALLQENQGLKASLDVHVAEATSSLRRDLDQVRRRLKDSEGLGEVVAMSPAMQSLLRETRLFHQNPDVPVLLEGETGSGKEILARAIHFGDTGSDAPFLAINCAAIPAELFESELFGHEAGAYTGSAPRGAQGKLELAGRGTLFLDEIAEMPLQLQPKLLRVLQERNFYRVGGVKLRQFHARVICAANRALEGMVHAGRFRRDLYHRLKVGHLVIPPLRQRPEDVLALAKMFLRRESAKKRKQFTTLHPAAMDVLLAHPWPGNVRELENTIERAVLTSNGEVLLPEHLHFLQPEAAPPPDPPRLAALSSLPPVPLPPPLSPRREESEIARLPPFLPPVLPRLDPVEPVLPEEDFDLEAAIDAIVAKAVARFGGNKTRAAQYLGISRFALHRRLHKK